MYEYTCDECKEEFEKLVFGSTPEIICPKCNKNNVKKKISAFGMM